MEQSTAAILWTFLLSGLALTGLGGLFLVKPGIRAALFHAINPAMKPPLAGKLSASLLASGILFLVVFLFEVIPYPHAKPYWVVVLSLVLSPLAITGFVAVTLAAVFSKKT